MQSARKNLSNHYSSEKNKGPRSSGSGHLAAVTLSRFDAVGPGDDALERTPSASVATIASTRSSQSRSTTGSLGKDLASRPLVANGPLIQQDRGDPARTASSAASVAAIDAIASQQPSAGGSGDAPTIRKRRDAKAASDILHEQLLALTDGDGAHVPIDAAAADFPDDA